MIKVKNKDERWVNIRFDLLHGVHLSEKDVKFENEDKLVGWVNKQKVADKPLWKYLLENHYRALNGEDNNHGINPNFQSLRDHVILPIITSNLFEILKDQDLVVKCEEGRRGSLPERRI